MPYQTISVSINNRIATVTIERESKLNALNHQTLSELKTAFSDLQTNDQVGGVILTGSGSKAFAAGADISEIQNLSLNSGRSFARFGQDVFNLIESLDKPVIALVNGFALGGGCELAMACHMRIASENARFGQPEVNLGLIPGYGGTQRLPRLIGRGRALELLLSGDMVSAQRAYEIGLVNKVVPADELEEAGTKLLSSILSKAPRAISHVLEAVNRGQELSLPDALHVEADYFGMSCATNDMKEGTSAFLERRKPEFKGN